jgi:hypothetical protein
MPGKAIKTPIVNIFWSVLRIRARCDYDFSSIIEKNGVIYILPYEVKLKFIFQDKAPWEPCLPAS